MKVLIAEDDPITLDAIESSLRAEGFTTLTARNGKEALQSWEKNHPDLVCLDIMMPEIGGYEVCRQIRATDSRIPIIFLSAKSEEVDVVLGLELGADDFVRKPFGRRELLARIHAALRRAASRQPVPHSFKMRDLIIYPDELRAMRGKREIELSPREAKLLTILYENAGRPVNRDTFLDRCWGMEYYPESRTLDQHMANLRKLIERDPSKPEIIETVRGAGYRYRPA
ncbi:MAG: response regulator transcription factor [Kiritimatiellaeota bacterium]|nr:response regulator transcription factor [Kiritimatiellota bacterium]